MCEPDEYCVKDPNSGDHKTCRKIALDERLGLRCDPGVGSGTVQQTSNYHLFCGEGFFDTNTFNAEWTGFCDKGVCKMCNPYSSSSGGGGSGAICRMDGTYVAAGDAYMVGMNMMFDSPLALLGFWAFMMFYVFIPCCCGIFCAIKKLSG
jgi:hypothetical protein